MNEKSRRHRLPYELEDLPEEIEFGEKTDFSESEIDSLQPYDTFVDGKDLYLGDGKNIYRVRRHSHGEEITLTADCIGICDPGEYELIRENEDGFASVVGFVESDQFAFYTEDDRFIPSPAEELDQTSLDFSSNAADKTVNKVL